jgi:hypothetical protein
MAGGEGAEFGARAGEEEDAEGRSVIATRSQIEAMTCIWR